MNVKFLFFNPYLILRVTNIYFPILVAVPKKISSTRSQKVSFFKLTTRAFWNFEGQICESFPNETFNLYPFYKCGVCDCVCVIANFPNWLMIFFPQTLNDQPSMRYETRVCASNKSRLSKYGNSFCWFEFAVKD